MAFDTKKWLMDELGFSADEADGLSPKFSDRADKIEKGYLRQSDYSRHMNDISKTQTDLKAANDKLTAEMAEWAELTAAEKRDAGDLKAKLDDSEAKAFALQQKLTRLAEDNGIDPKTILPSGDPAQEPAKPAAFDAKEFGNRIGAQIGGVADYMLTLTAELPTIAQEHFDLTGERLDTRKFIADIKADIKAGKTENLDPVKRWESQFQIDAKRSAKRDADVDTRIKTAVAEAETRVRSEASLPPTAKPGSHAPVFHTSNVTKGSVLQRPQPSQRLAGAVAALASGKYRKVS